jgi:hypothetical protein
MSGSPHQKGMAKNNPAFTQNALRVIEQATGGKVKQPKEKNPAAVALGFLGGNKGVEKGQKA